MAAVAGQAVVLVAGNSLMMAVGIGPVMLMAINAFEYREVAEIDVAVGAGAPTSKVSPRIDGEILGIVNPGGWDPGRCCVAGLALKRESNLAVIGVGSPLVIRLVAAIAVGGSIIITRCMTSCAWGRQMGACQRKLRVAVIERGGSPG